jgi:hypothetical protein
MRVTVTVTSSGDMLTPLFVFKRAHGGRTERELASYGHGAVYSVQKKTRMDECIMTQWIDQVLLPC